MRKIEDVILKNGRNLKYVLELHKKWLKGEEDGKIADLSWESLSDVDLSNSDLSYANLTGTNLIGANLRGANLIATNLTDANLTYADLTSTNLESANLTYVDLTGADLTNAKLSYANLTCAKLTNANLTDVKYNPITTSFALQCPEEGSFIGYKKADDKIVKLLITEDAKRSSATTRKCRCSKAKVLSITSLDGKKKFKKVTSDNDTNFVYKVGKIVKVKDFDENRWNECSTGIHFFITRDEAVMY